MQWLFIGLTAAFYQDLRPHSIRTYSTSSSRHTSADAVSSVGMASIAGCQCTYVFVEAMLCCGRETQ